ncbi:MAG: hypothetical protein PHE15_02085 [Dehalococcoidales bacterium]|nr:hypothetical protein [Dehalococcoidales bacterium]
MNPDNKNRELVTLLQSFFPLTVQPYKDIGLALRINEQEVITLISGLKAEGIIRQIGPIFSTKRLGYKTTLAAMEVAEDKLEEASRAILKHPGISHGYVRDNRFNLWVTLATSKDIDLELATLAEQVGADVYLNLPVVNFFKLCALFNVGGDERSEVILNHTNEKSDKQEDDLSPEDKKIINEIQQDLPLVSQPFAGMSANLGIGEEEFLSRCQSLGQRGIMRRFGAAVNHRKAGYIANAMTCWQVSPDKVEDIGKKLSAQTQVSHCYERKTNPLWRYNMFAMIHGYSEDECRQVAEKVSSETGLNDYTMLFSTREIKKTRIKYIV